MVLARFVTFFLMYLLLSSFILAEQFLSLSKMEVSSAGSHMKYFVGKKLLGCFSITSTIVLLVGAYRIGCEADCSKSSINKTKPYVGFKKIR